jgi:hypothetical protein
MMLLGTKTPAPHSLRRDTPPAPGRPDPASPPAAALVPHSASPLTSGYWVSLPHRHCSTGHSPYPGTACTSIPAKARSNPRRVYGECPSVAPLNYTTSREFMVARPISHKIVTPRLDIVLASRPTDRAIPPLAGGYEDMVCAIWFSLSAGERVMPTARLVGIQRPYLVFIPRCNHGVAHGPRPCTPKSIPTKATSNPRVYCAPDRPRD